MKHDSLKDEMKYYLNNGIIQDIYLCRQSYALLMTTGKNGPKLGVSVYVDFFQSLQNILMDHFIVHVVKLFEKPNNRYDTISIPSILKFISENIAQLEIIERPLVCKHLATLGVIGFNSFSYSSTELSKIIIDHFESEIKMIEDSPAFQRLLILRNKRVAHREAIDISNSPKSSFGDSLELIKFAQNFTIIVGAAYTSTIHGFINEQFILGEDAERSSTSLNKIFATLINS